MPELHWDEVREFFDPDLMGALPDLFVPDATVEDWQAVFDLVAASGWRWQYEEGNTVLPLPAAAEVLARPVGADTLCAFLQAIGSRLGKPVLMTREGGSQEHPVLGFDPDLNRVTLRPELATD